LLAPFVPRCAAVLLLLFRSCIAATRPPLPCTAGTTAAFGATGGLLRGAAGAANASFRESRTSSMLLSPAAAAATTGERAWRSAGLEETVALRVAALDTHAEQLL
jgi:hypothetical protein